MGPKKNKANEHSKKRNRLTENKLIVTGVRGIRRRGKIGVENYEV